MDETMIIINKEIHENKSMMEYMNKNITVQMSKEIQKQTAHLKKSNLEENAHGQDFFAGSVDSGNLEKIQKDLFEQLG